MSYYILKLIDGAFRASRLSKKKQDGRSSLHVQAAHSCFQRSHGHGRLP